MDDEKLIDRVQKIPIAELVPFKDHPFRVVEDESMLLSGKLNDAPSVTLYDAVSTYPQACAAG